LVILPVVPAVDVMPYGLLSLILAIVLVVHMWVTSDLVEDDKWEKRLAGWCIVWFVLAGFSPPLYFKWRREMATATEGDLIGAGDDLLPNGAVPWVQIGNSQTLQTMMPPTAGKATEPYYKPFPDAEFLVESGRRGPLISTTVRDRFGNLMVEMNRNHWRVYPQFCPDKNYTKYAFECRDSAGHVSIQIRFMPMTMQPQPLPPRVQVQGEWWSTEGRGIRMVVGEDGKAYAMPLGTTNQHIDYLIKPMFKYPGKDHWQVFEKN